MTDLIKDCFGRSLSHISFVNQIHILNFYSQNKRPRRHSKGTPKIDVQESDKEGDTKESNNSEEVHNMFVLIKYLFKNVYYYHFDNLRTT